MSKRQNYTLEVYSSHIVPILSLTLLNSEWQWSFGCSECKSFKCTSLSVPVIYNIQVIFKLIQIVIQISELEFSNNCYRKALNYFAHTNIFITITYCRSHFLCRCCHGRCWSTLKTLKQLSCFVSMCKLDCIKKFLKLGHLLKLPGNYSNCP